MRFYSCPLAEFVAPGSAMWGVVRAHRQIDVEGVSLRDLYRRPTAGMLDGLAEVDGAVQALQAVQRERAMEAARRKAESKRGR